MKHLTVLIVLAITYLASTCAMISSSSNFMIAPGQEEELPFLFDIAITDVDEASIAISMSLSIRISSPVAPSAFYCTMENRYGRASGGVIYLNVSRMALSDKFFEGAHVYFLDARVKLSPFGPREFYPHDSYLLNISFVFEDGGLAEAGLIGVDVSCAEWTWRVRSSFEFTRGSPQAIVMVRIVVERITSFFTPYYVALFTSSVLLGASLLLGPDALASRLALYLSLIFSIMSLLGQVSSVAPEERAFSLAEYMLIDVCVATSLLCVESVFEYLCYEHISPRAYGRAQVVLKLFFSLIGAFTFIAHLGMFSDASSLFPWTSVPASDFLMPSASILFFALVASYTEHRKATSSATP